MAGATQYELWFGNQSGAGGNACVYQPTQNVTLNQGTPDQLAWMVTGANPGVWVRFLWTVSYDFVWIDQAATRSLQIEPADLQTANQITLSYNQYGFLFSAPTAGTPAGTLLIGEGSTIPATTRVVTGIGMSKAGTLALPAKSNQNLAFEPVAEASLSYLITFGQYTFGVGDVITPTTLNPPGTVQFDPGVTAMTAIVDTGGGWTVTDGAPPQPMVQDMAMVKTYRAGVGLLTSS